MSCTRATQISPKSCAGPWTTSGYPRSGCAAYIRAPALSLHAAFIEGLAETAVRTLARGEGVAPGSSFTCAAEWTKCPRRAEEVER